MFVFVIGVGLIGGALLDEIASNRSVGSKIEVAAIANSTRLLECPQLDGWRQQLAERGTKYHSIHQLLEKAAELAQKQLIVVDCTSSKDLAGLYVEWMRMGIPVVAANKRPFSESQELFNSIRKMGGLCRFEATVGAGLPAIGVLSDMLSSGDKIQKIEAILSGTCAFICSEFMSSPTKAFSQIVHMAKGLGLTEPDPRDDLSGMDVVRKATILGRLCGMSLPDAGDPAYSQVGILPDLLLSKGASVDEFMAGLGSLDSYFDDLRRDACADKKVLRYVATIDPPGNAISIGLQR